MPFSLKTAIKSTLLYLFLTFLIFIFIEGLSSSALIMRRIVKLSFGSIFYQYDPLLGWSLKPNLDLQGIYGPGINLKTNPQGFRASSFNTESKDNLTVLCSGDSFTFGLGVSDSDTWCQQLSSFSPRIEPINLGVPDYNIDQAYLRYLKDGVSQPHQVHIFAFIHDDFLRAGPKRPVLALEKNDLAVRNSPVQKSSFVMSKIISELEKFQCFYIAKKILVLKITKKQLSEKRQQTVLRIFENLDQKNKERHSKTIFVYLPIKEDYSGSENTQWRETLKSEAKKRGWLFVDLIEEFKKSPLTAESLEALFLPKQSYDPFHTADHYSSQGNKYIARMLFEKLHELELV